MVNKFYYNVPQRLSRYIFITRKTFSFVLYDLSDAQYCFTAIDVGGYGRHSDSGIFQKSNMGKHFICL